jgi:hypothetical protein
MPAFCDRSSPSAISCSASSQRPVTRRSMPSKKTASMAGGNAPPPGGRHDEIEGGPAGRQSLRVGSGHGHPGDAEWVGNRSESGDRLVQGIGRGGTGTGRVAEQHCLQLEWGWRVRHPLWLAV